MAYMSGFVNIIRGSSPAAGATEVPVDGEVRILFTFDMVPDTINTSNILILDESTEKVPATLSYSNRTAFLKPIENLMIGHRYQVLIKGGTNGIKSVLDDTLSTDYIFSFETSKATPVGQVQLVFPADRSVVRASANFSWEAVPGADAYEFEISTESKFGSVSFSTNVVETSIVPNFTFEHDTNYFWRVMAFNAEDNGLWSDVWQFRYTALSAEEEDEQGNIPGEEIAVFDFVEVSPRPDSLFVPVDAEIKAKFNQSVDPETANNLLVFFEDVDGVGEPTNVLGTVDCQDDTLKFVPEAPLAENGIYTVELYKEVASVDGLELPDDTTWTFATVFNPYYSSVRAVRAEIGSFLESIPDLDIAREILSVSKWADQIAARPYGEINDDYLGETQSKTTNCIFYQNYTKFETCIRLLNRAMTEHMEYHGKQMEIGDLKVKSSGSMTPDSNIVLKRLETLRNKAETYLTMGRQTYSLPTSAIKGNTNYPYSLNKRNSF